MTNKNKRDDALAAEYALGTLRGNARLRFQRRMQEEPELTARVSRWQSLLVGLDNNLAPVTPPEAVWKRISLALPVKKRRSPLQQLLPWLAAASVAIVVMGSVLIFREPTLLPVAVLSDAHHNGQWVVAANSERDQISVSPLQPLKVNSSQSLELWLIPTGQKPVSLGLVNDTKTSEFIIKTKGSLNNAVLAISLEPKGGSPTGQPTGAVLYSATF